MFRMRTASTTGSTVAYYGTMNMRFVASPMAQRSRNVTSSEHRSDHVIVVQSTCTLTHGTHSRAMYCTPSIYGE